MEHCCHLSSLFFALGAAAAFARVRSFHSSKPSPKRGWRSILMAAIGLKGGVQVSDAGFSTEMLAGGGGRS